MTALRLEDQAGAYSAELAPLAVPDPSRRRAGIVVCSQARSADDARELLDMLGLLNPDDLPQPVQAPPAPAPRPKQAASKTSARTSATKPVKAVPAQPATAPARKAAKPRAAKPATTPVRIAPTVPAQEPAKRAPAGKLTCEDAEAIRRRWAAGDKVTQRQLAAEYNVDQKTISDVVRYVTWTDGSPIIGECAGCGRSMITQKAYLRNPDWREKGFVRHASSDRCNGCYLAWRKRGGQATPRFAAHQVQIQPYYPVICQKCGPVGEPPTTREAANRIRDAHLAAHRKPQPAANPARHRAGHALGLAEHVEKGEPLCPPCQELCDILAAGGHLAPARRIA